MEERSINKVLRRAVMEEKLLVTMKLVQFRVRNSVKTSNVSVTVRHMVEVGVMKSGGGEAMAPLGATLMKILRVNNRY